LLVNNDKLDISGFNQVSVKARILYSNEILFTYRLVNLDLRPLTF